MQQCAVAIVMIDLALTSTAVRRKILTYVLIVYIARALEKCLPLQMNHVPEKFFKAVYLRMEVIKKIF